MRFYPKQCCRQWTFVTWDSLQDISEEWPKIFQRLEKYSLLKIKAAIWEALIFLVLCHSIQVDVASRYYPVLFIWAGLVLDRNKATNHHGKDRPGTHNDIVYHFFLSRQLQLVFETKLMKINSDGCFKRDVVYISMCQQVQPVMLPGFEGFQR